MAFVHEEQPTGRTVTVSKCTNPWVKDEAKQVWADVEVPTFWYSINQAPHGGFDLKLNGVPYYQDQIVELDAETLASVKEVIGRGWDHEASLRDKNENAYRRPEHRKISGVGMA